jgi:hypothetical protein
MKSHLPLSVGGWHLCHKCHWSRDTVIIGATAQMKTQEIDRIQFYSESSDNPTGKARKK